MDKQFVASFSCFACQFLLGAIIGQSSVMLPQLQARDSPIKIDDEYASWIASISSIGTPFSSIICGPLTDKLGRKSMIKVFLLLSAVGHLIVGVSSDMTGLLIGRFFLGIAAGFSFPSYVYVSEISTPQLRSLLLAVGTVSSAVGLLHILVVGGILNWDLTSLITCVLSMISFGFTVFIPESPAWLFRNDRLKETIESLKWLKGSDCNVDKELKLLKDACIEVPKGNSIFQHILSSTVWKPFLILVTLAILQNGTGFFILNSYSISLFEMFETKFDPWIVSIILSTIRPIACAFASYLLKKNPRKRMGALSGFLMATNLGVLYLIHHVFKSKITDPTHYSLLISLSFVLYVIFCCLGVYPLSWIMIYELYPLHTRGLMCGVSNGINFIFAFIFNKLFYFFISHLQLHGTVLMFLLFSFGFGVFSKIVLPETHGKSLVEIEQGFRTNKKKGKDECLDFSPS